MARGGVPAWRGRAHGMALWQGARRRGAGLARREWHSVAGETAGALPLPDVTFSCCLNQNGGKCFPRFVIFVF
ncbi:hypothetical protein DAI22_01g045900 [Oryza sativa Japonica Group]|nr:hypothetical protein DAI22_01g045900 [Oryza sativa Japonica Group]